MINDSWLDDVEIGIGTWAWGDAGVWGYGKEYGEPEVHGAFDAAVDSGVRLFDTAEIYGRGESERLLGRFMKQRAETIRIATKFMPLPWRWRDANLLSALRRSLDRLGVGRVDLYQIHMPLPPRPVTSWMPPLAEAVTQELVRDVGVSNYSERQMRAAADRLAQLGARLATNQVQYSLLKRNAEFNGVLNACRELNVRLIAYSPLAMGLLSAKYTTANPPPGLRGFRYRKTLARLEPLVTLLHDVGQAHGGRTRSQVALNWIICKGALPIPGAKNGAQSIENAGAAGWRLAADEVARLDEASLPFTRL
jgi:aryl-alcohol dehydrogenase-like predicted oxidoreductase